MYYMFADIQQTIALSRKVRKMVSQAEAKAAAQEAVPLENKEGNSNIITRCVVTTRSTSSTKISAPEVETTETWGQCLENNLVDHVQKPVGGISMSRNAIKNRRRRAARRTKKAISKILVKEDNEEGETVGTPKIQAVQDFKPIIDLKSSANQVLVDNNNISRKTMSKQMEAHLPKWLRSTAQLIWVESTQEKRHEFYYGEELDAHEKIYCVLHSIDDSCLSHDGYQRPVYSENWHDWKQLRSPCKGGRGEIPQSDSKVYIRKIPFIGVDTESAIFYQTVDEHLNYHTFTADGTPVHAAQMLEWHEKEFNRRCKSSRDFEALIDEKEVELAESCGITYGRDGNPNAETLSNLEYGGVVYRGRPRTVYSHVMVPTGRDKDGNIIRKHEYTKTLLAYKSFYRVMTTSNKEIYHFGGEQLFYQSGQPCVHLYGNPEGNVDTFQEFVYL